jgi:apolipoprotein N-acyltransferase
MKRTLSYLTALFLTVSVLIFAFIYTDAQTKTVQKPAQDPVVNFRLSLPQASQIIYAIRYTTILDAKSANELADLLVNQSNDTTLNKRPGTAEKPKHK